MEPIFEKYLHHILPDHDNRMVVVWPQSLLQQRTIIPHRISPPALPCTAERLESAGTLSK